MAIEQNPADKTAPHNPPVDVLAPEQATDEASAGAAGRSVDWAVRPLAPTAHPDRIEVPRKAAVAAAAVAVVVLVVGALSLWGYFDKGDELDAAQQHTADGKAAISVGKGFLDTVFNVDQQNLNNWNKSVDGVAVESLHAKLNQMKSAYADFIKAKMSMTAAVADIAIVDQTDSTAKLVAIVEYTANSPAHVKPLTSNDGLYLELTKTDGEWKVSGYKPAIGVIGGDLPTPAAPAPTPPAPPAPPIPGR